MLERLRKGERGINGAVNLYATANQFSARVISIHQELLDAGEVPRTEHGEDEEIGTEEAKLDSVETAAFMPSVAGPSFYDPGLFVLTGDDEFEFVEGSQVSANFSTLYCEVLTSCYACCSWPGCCLRSAEGPRAPTKIPIQ